MPPKSKITGKKSKKAKIAAVVDGKSTVDMTKDELEAHLIRIREELQRERADRNYFQIERDKVATFWSLSKRQLEDRTAELRAKQHELEEAVERREQEIGLYRQKVKHLLAMHQTEATALKVDMMESIKLASQEASGWEPRLMDAQLRKEQLDHDGLVRQMRLDHEERMHELRKDFEMQSDAERRKNDEKLREIYESMDLQRRTALQTTEERKNDQIATLIRNHEKAFRDIKNYYNDITTNTLSLIDSLKAQVEEIKSKELKVSKENTELAQTNINLEFSLKKTEKECEKLRRHLENHNRDVKALKNSKDELKRNKKTLSNVKLENEVLIQQLRTATSERDELYARFVSGIQEVRQKCSLKDALLERKIAVLEETLGPPGDIQDSLECKKNKQIKELHYELARVCKTHNDLLLAFKGQMENYGIPVANLGFQANGNGLLKGMWVPLGKGPAGLATITTA